MSDPNSSQEMTVPENRSPRAGIVIAIVRSGSALLAAFALAMVLIMVVEGFGAIAHPFPPGADTTDYEVCKAHVAKFPSWILAVVVVAWGGTVFVSSWLATRLGYGRHPWHGFFIGALLLLAVGFNMWMLPYPRWFEIANYVTFPLAVLSAVKTGGSPSARQRRQPAAV